MRPGRCPAAPGGSGRSQRAHWRMGRSASGTMGAGAGRAALWRDMGRASELATVLNSANRAAVGPRQRLEDPSSRAGTGGHPPDTWRLPDCCGEAGNRRGRWRRVFRQALRACWTMRWQGHRRSRPKAGAVLSEGGPETAPYDDAAWRRSGRLCGDRAVTLAAGARCAAQTDGGDIEIAWARRARDHSASRCWGTGSLWTEAERYRLDIGAGPAAQRDAGTKRLSLHGMRGREWPGQSRAIAADARRHADQSDSVPAAQRARRFQSEGTTWRRYAQSQPALAGGGAGAKPSPSTGAAPRNRCSVVQIAVSTGDERAARQSRRGHERHIVGAAPSGVWSGHAGRSRAAPRRRLGLRRAPQGASSPSAPRPGGAGLCGRCGWLDLFLDSRPGGADRDRHGVRCDEPSGGARAGDPADRPYRPPTAAAAMRR